jgi:hypothetical protein
MASFGDIRRDAPELAARARRVFDAHKHKTIATLRGDGSPRISGTEADFTDDELMFGSMPGSRKSTDLLRDPRFALHSATVDPELTDGDAKVSGRALLVTGHDFEAYVRRRAESNEPVPEGSFDLFRADITDVVVVRIGDPADHLVIESWREGRGYERVERR